jgi:hypothetical protein
LAAAIGKHVPPDTELLFGETDESNPFVSEEQAAHHGVELVSFESAEQLIEGIEVVVQQRSAMNDYHRSDLQLEGIGAVLFLRAAKHVVVILRHQVRTKPAAARRHVASGWNWVEVSVEAG